MDGQLKLRKNAEVMLIQQDTIRFKKHLVAECSILDSHNSGPLSHYIGEMCIQIKSFLSTIISLADESDEISESEISEVESDCPSLYSVASIC
jgi:hypothetical protein